ncbi:MAG TPA: gamma-glutamyl-gamma-aminobutyrate hydrolase family protein [Candidatus Acidoferrales bacterium]|nr:gamma-glutamyl-gamma-aminobutyrate hydrolase family protein [Candidatus Acidoferrales bacterium]
MTERGILIVDCGSRIGSIERIVTDFGCEPHKIALGETAKVNADDWSGVIISGSPILLTEQPYQKYLESLRFARTTKRPILGICFGHQIIGLLHGATVFRGVECRANHTVEVIQRDTLFDGLESNLCLREDHCEGITLPAQFLHLAKSESYAVEAMKHRDKDLYGVQFHPEASGEAGQRIMRNFLRLCK